MSKQSCWSSIQTEALSERRVATNFMCVLQGGLVRRQLTSGWRISCSWLWFGSEEGGFVLAKDWAIYKGESLSYHFAKTEKGRKLRKNKYFYFLCNREGVWFLWGNKDIHLLRCIYHFLDLYLTSIVWSRKNVLDTSLQNPCCSIP